MMCSTDKLESFTLLSHRVVMKASFCGIRCCATMWKYFVSRTLSATKTPTPSFRTPATSISCVLATQPAVQPVRKYVVIIITYRIVLFESWFNGEDNSFVSELRKFYLPHSSYPLTVSVRSWLSQVHP